MIRVIFFLFLVFISSFSLAQIPHVLSVWDHPLTNNPGIVGAFSDDAIQMGILSVSTTPNYRTTLATTPYIRDNTFNNRNTDKYYLIREDISKVYFMNSYKSFTFSNGNRFTGGLQLKKHESVNLQLHDASQIGFTCVYHKQLKSRRDRKRYFSTGIQLSLLPTSIKHGVAQFAYDNLLGGNQSITYHEYVSQFRNIGFEQYISINYSYFRKRKTFFNIGLTVQRTEFKELSNFLFNDTGIYRFNSTSDILLSLSIEYQLLVNKKFLLFFNAFTYNKLEYLGGFGIRLWKNNLLKIGIGPYPLERIGMIYLSFETRNYKYMLNLDSRNNIFNSTPQRAFFAQLAVQYRITPRSTSTLFSLH